MGTLRVAISKKGYSHMINQFDEIKIPGQGDLQNLNLGQAQIHSAKSLADLNKLTEKIQASNKARSKAQELAVQKRDQIESKRHSDNTRLSVIAISIAAISMILSVISIFK